MFHSITCITSSLHFGIMIFQSKRTFCPRQAVCFTLNELPIIHVDSTFPWIRTDLTKLQYICLQQILQLKQSSTMNFTSLNFIRLLRVVITPSVTEGAITTRSNRMKFSLEFYQFSQIDSRKKTIFLLICKWVLKTRNQLCYKP